MKFSINKDEIIHQLQSLAAVADKKQTLPILSNIYLKCSGAELTLKSTDLEVELEFKLTTQNSEDGETTIPSKKISDIVRELPEGEIAFSLNDDGNKMQVKSSSGRYNLATISA